ncbi:hypothetical protein XENOCAPTIV_011762 [Xenoophorus captivus]|uniref:Uncharacterized protein n=1 Tax=Xenoophorus captivus TaxID=1517983 RepID=A0ABV0RY88_9TELE
MVQINGHCFSLHLMPLGSIFRGHGMALYCLTIDFQLRLMMMGALAQRCPLCPLQLLALLCSSDRTSQKMSASGLQPSAQTPPVSAGCTVNPQHATSNLAPSLLGRAHIAELWSGALESRMAGEEWQDLVSEAEEERLILCAQDHQGGLAGA